MEGDIEYLGEPESEPNSGAPSAPRDRLRVAVCTNRAPEQVAGCLAALLEQVDAAELALVVNGLSPREAERHREAFPGTVLVEPAAGLSRARNRALEWCEDEDVLAFVDDDALVAEGWRATLGRRWAEAPSTVACIGGPIYPRYAVPPPAWLPAPVGAALTVLDLGPETLDLDPRVTTVYGANISFRAGPLRAVGGFDPAFGHRGRRISFSEEDEAELKLAAAGYGVRYVPDAPVWHVIPAERLTRASFLRRRFAYGRTLGLRRGRSPSFARRQAVKSSLGCLTAAAMGRDALVMERATRAAENWGVVLAPLLARRGGDSENAPRGKEF